MKFRHKITLCMILLLTVMFSIGGTLLITTSFNDAMNRERIAAYNAYQSLLGTLQIATNVNRTFGFSELNSLMQELPSQVTETYHSVRLYRTDGMIYEKGDMPLPMFSHTGSPETCSIRYSTDSQNRHYYLVSGTLEALNETLYMDLSYDVTSVIEGRDYQIRIYRYLFVILLVLGAAVSYGLSYALTYPMAVLSRASRKIADGRLDTRAAVRTHDEIGTLAGDFNRMADTIEQDIRDLEESIEREKRFVGSFAHEVKTPMTSIIGYADLIRSESLTREETVEAANFIFREGKRMEHLSKRLLEMQMLAQEQVQFRSVDMLQLIGSIAEDWRDVYGKEGITLSSSGESCVCMAEPELIRTLILNLMDNAKKALHGQRGAISLRCEKHHNACRLTVSDNGTGIPEESLAHLTEAFYRVDKSRARALGGVGLGLSLCKEIAELHNGRISFESEIGKGTTVIVDLEGGTD